MRKLAFTIACAAFLFAGTAAANSQEETDAPRSTDSTKELRLDVRLGTGWLMLTSVSVVARPLELPLAIDAGFWALPIVAGGYLRAGWAFGLADFRRGSARGSTLELTPMVGVLAGFADGSGEKPRLASPIPEAVVSLDWTWWLTRSFGVGATATLGALYPLERKSSDDSLLYPDARLAFGVSF